MGRGVGRRRRDVLFHASLARLGDWVGQSRLICVRPPSSTPPVCRRNEAGKTLAMLVAGIQPARVDQGEDVPALRGLPLQVLNEIVAEGDRVHVGEDTLLAQALAQVIVGASRGVGQRCSPTLRSLRCSSASSRRLWNTLLRTGQSPGSRDRAGAFTLLAELHARFSQG